MSWHDGLGEEIAETFARLEVPDVAGLRIEQSAHWADRHLYPRSVDKRTAHATREQHAAYRARHRDEINARKREARRKKAA